MYSGSTQTSASVPGVSDHQDHHPSNFVTQHNADAPVSFFLDRRKVLTVYRSRSHLYSDFDLKKVHEPGF
jgi:hypothetical protein